jgi:hypothetical protein
MYKLRRFSTSHAHALEKLYVIFERILVGLHRHLAFPGRRKLEPAVTAIERRVKGLLFDSQMCGSCTLGSTGMTCPMNCPKKMRNGPCGGVRQNGMCEIKPDMPCVWLDAYAGSLQIDNGVRILEIQQAVDHRLAGTSSWLHEVRKKAQRQ